MYGDLDGQDVLSYGSITDAGPNETAHTVFTPPLRRRMALNAGESAPPTDTMLTFSNRIGGALTGPATSTQVRETVTYLGQETITVPAGTFVTCKFRYLETADGVTTETLEWLAKPSGVQIRYVQTSPSTQGNDVFTAETLGSSRLNGVALQ